MWRRKEQRLRNGWDKRFGQDILAFSEEEGRGLVKWGQQLGASAHAAGLAPFSFSPDNYERSLSQSKGSSKGRVPSGIAMRGFPHGSLFLWVVRFRVAAK